MKINISKTTELKGYYYGSTFTEEENNITVTVNDCGKDTVKLSICTPKGSTTLHLHANDARTLANMLFTVSDTIHDEWQGAFNKKPLTRKKP